MGNSGSHRVTVVNDDSVGIVHISDNVAKRLREKSRLNEREQTKVAEPPPKKTVIDEPIPEPPRIESLSKDYPSDSYLSTLEQRQKYNAEFKEAQAKWQNQMNELKQQNQQLFKAAQKKLAAEIERVENEYVKQSLEPVCPDKQENVLKCYQENSTRPLFCNKQVKAFVECLEQTRLSVISAQG